MERKDPALDGVVPPGARPEALATGFGFTEGPVWSPDGDLLFSDPNENTIYRWSRDGQVSIFRTKSGYAGVDISEYKQPGSNGLTFDPQGRLTVCQHGERRVIRIEPTGAITVLADRYQGKRLNSPNDLVYRKDGTLYFTDPPFGLPKVFDDPRKELAVLRRVPGEGRGGDAGGEGPHRAQRHRLQPGREVPLRHQLGRDEEGRHALPGGRRRHPGNRLRCSST